MTIESHPRMLFHFGNSRHRMKVSPWCDLCSVPSIVSTSRPSPSANLNASSKPKVLGLSRRSRIPFRMSPGHPQRPLPPLQPPGVSQSPPVTTRH